MVKEVSKEIQELNKNTVPSGAIGQSILTRLQKIDPTAFVRFASVYNTYDDINDFFSKLKKSKINNQESDNN